MNLLLVVSTIILGFLSLFLLWKKSYRILFNVGFVLAVTMGLLRYYYVEKKDVVIVVLAPDYMPYSYMENDKTKGIDITILKEVVEKGMKKKLVFKSGEWASLMDMDGDIICGGVCFTEKRELNLSKNSPHLCFSTGYGLAITAIVTRPNIKVINADDNTFKGVIVVQKDSIFFEIARSKFPDAKIVLKDNFHLAVEELKNGKADCIMADALVLLDTFQKNDLQEGYAIYKLKLHNGPKYIAFIINSKKIDLDQFNTLLIIAQQKITNSKYKKLIQKLLELETV